LAFFSSLYAIYIVAHTMLYGTNAPGYASLMIMVLMLGSMNIIATGILGEYVGRIYNEVRNRPLYLVRETQGFNPQQEKFESWKEQSTTASINSKDSIGGSARAARS
jgi:polyisoprenyl-phosphate glycosyltransferase